MTHRPSRACQLQNRAFLATLKETGNVLETCRRLSVQPGMMRQRRTRDPGFAVRWDAALTVAHARLNTSKPGRITDETHLVRTKSGKLQLRRLPPGRLTRAVEQRFLYALSASCNVRLSAAAAGLSVSVFYNRARTSAAFAREMRLALELGYERLEMALLAEVDPTSAEDDAWRSNAPPPIPAMRPDQAIDLLKLHLRTVQLQEDTFYGKRRRNETEDAWRARRSAEYFARRDRDQDAARVALATYYAAVGTGAEALEHAPPWLPMLEQVREWRATGRMPDAAEVDASRERLRAAAAGGWGEDGPQTARLSATRASPASGAVTSRRRGLL